MLIVHGRLIQRLTTKKKIKMKPDRPKFGVLEVVLKYHPESIKGMMYAGYQTQCVWYNQLVTNSLTWAEIQFNFMFTRGNI
jgi:hypothetical protein